MTTENNTYLVHFETIKVNIPGNKREGYGELMITASSLSDAVHIANGKLLALDLKIRGSYVGRQEIHGENGWYLFSNQGLEDTVSAEPRLKQEPKDTVYYR